MKIEPFPWLRDYLVDMNKLYTELILEKIENEVLGLKMVTLAGYKEMFDSNGRDKILIKGDPGMGKTTLAKKVGWDWSRGEFKLYSIVFFVFLKFVQPGDSIESVILKQNPELEALGVSPEKLHSVLDRFSERCLLILDGLDEHGLGKNKDVLKIIRKEKLLDCGVIVSSRPHNTKEVEIYFPTIIRVDGFNMREAERFISNFFTDKNKIEEIMSFKPSDSREQFPIQYCPILLSFFCFLVAENEIEMTDKTIRMGDIYTRLVKCLYKKYTIRKHIQFKLDDFLQVLKSVGKLALTTLKSNNPLLKRSKVLSDVGDDAFEYGFFAGHEDFRLLGDLSADIYVTYPHRSLEEFFGSFGFCQALSEGKSVEEILGLDSKSSLLLMNPLFLKFSLWFLLSPIFNFQQRDECYDKITSYVASHIDSVEFDTEETRQKYPAFDVMSLLIQTENLERPFIRDTFAKCKCVKSFVCLLQSLPNGIYEMVLKSISGNFLNNLTKIILVRGYERLRDIDGNAFTLSIALDEPDALELLRLFLHKYKLSHRNPQVYLKLRARNMSPCDVITLITKDVEELNKYIKEIQVQYQLFGIGPHFKASGKFPHCPTFRRLSIEGHHIDGSVPSALKEASQGGKLPNFRSVDLENCCGHISETDWPEEVELNVSGTRSGNVPYEPCSLCSRQEGKGEK